MTCPSTCKPVSPANRQSELTPAYQIPLVMQNGRMRQMNAGERVSPEFLGDVATFDAQGRLLGAGGVVLDVGAAQAMSSDTALAIGRKWAFGGDSITNGSSSSNFTYSYTFRAKLMVGHLVCASSYVEAGTPGQRSDQLLTQMESVIGGGLDVDAWHIQIGTNDASQGVAPAVFIENIRKICTLARGKGMRKFSVGTVPPRGSGRDVSGHRLAQAYNALINLYVPKWGGVVAQVSDALADPATGNLLAAYDSGDGIHPNDAGHSRIAEVVSEAMVTVSGMPGNKRTWLRSPYGSITQDPLQQRASVTGGGWSEQAGGTGTAPTYSFESDTYGVLPAGRWAKMAFNATAGGTRRLAAGASSGFAVGDKIAATAVILIEDLAGTWETTTLAGTSSVQVNVVKQTGVAISTYTLGRCIGRKIGAGLYLYHVSYTVDVPADATSVILWCGLTLPTGSSVNMLVGCAGLMNLNALGIDAYADNGSFVPT